MKARSKPGQPRRPRRLEYDSHPILTVFLSRPLVTASKVVVRFLIDCSSIQCSGVFRWPVNILCRCFRNSPTNLLISFNPRPSSRPASGLPPPTSSDLPPSTSTPPPRAPSVHPQCRHPQCDSQTWARRPCHDGRPQLRRHPFLPLFLFRFFLSVLHFCSTVMCRAQSMAVGKSLATTPSSSSQPGRVSSPAPFLTSSAGMDLELLTMVFVSSISLLVLILHRFCSLVFCQQEKSIRFWVLVFDPLPSSICLRPVVVSWISLLVLHCGSEHGDELMLRIPSRL
jgi:hypothetical protein